MTTGKKSSIAILVLGAPYADGSCQTAFEFAKAVIAKDWHIEQIFFYHEATTVSSQLSVSAQDEINLADAWQELIAEHAIEAITCIASGLKRGIIDASEAKRYEKPQHSISPVLELGGLGLWIEAINKADRHIVFGA